MVNDVHSGWVRKVQALAEAHETEISRKDYEALEDRFRTKIAEGLPPTITEDDLRIRQRHGHK